VTYVAYAHDAVVVLYDVDPRAPGGRITAELCGNWDHNPPCPLWPHHVDATPGNDDTLRLRVLFAAEPADEEHVRQLIRLALGSGQQAGPDGHVTFWMLESEDAGSVRPDESDHAARLVAN
jgi:hypothetical protein